MNTALLIILLVIGSFGGRFVGSAIGRKTGARHFVAWFGAVLGCVLALFVDLSIENQQPIANMLKDGYLAATLFLSCWIAVMVELIASIKEYAARSNRAKEQPDAPNQDSPKKNRLRSAITTSVIIVLLVVGFYKGYEPVFRFRATRDRIHKSVDELSHRRPESLSKSQWAFIIYWTQMGVGNCYFMPSSIKDSQRSRNFADELVQRLKGEVDLSTIDWIWDEFVANTTHGQRYSDNWRPTTPERLQRAKTDNSDYGIEAE